MYKTGIIASYLAFWAIIILGSMYLTGTWYPLMLLAFMINFNVDLD